MIPEGICEVAIKGGDTLGRADDIGIVEERKHALAWLQCGRNGVKGGVLGDRVECRHQRVALLPALGLQDLVFRADIVGPDIAALGAVELARQERGKLRSRAQAIEHGLSGDMVERPDSVDRQDGGARVAFSGDLEELVERLGARTRAEAELVAHAGILECCSEVLGQGASDKAAKDVANNQGTQSAGRLPECDYIIWVGNTFPPGHVDDIPMACKLRLISCLLL